MTFRRPYQDGRMDDRPVDQVQAEARQRLAALGMPLRMNPRWDAHTHEIGAASCESCSAHDHSDGRVFGYTITAQRATKPQKDGTRTEFSHRLPVEASRFTCPQCGDPETAAMLCDVWTADGAAFRRANPELFPGQQPMFVEGEQEDDRAW